VGSALVVTDPADDRTRTLTTIAEAADFAAVTPGMPLRVYRPATPLDLDEPPSIDPDSAQRLASWYELADTALRRFATEVGAASEDPVLWPEHFDIGITVDAVTTGHRPAMTKSPSHIFTSGRTAAPSPAMNSGTRHSALP
jgi:hypothetical protein